MQSLASSVGWKVIGPMLTARNASFVACPRKRGMISRTIPTSAITYR